MDLRFLSLPFFSAEHTDFAQRLVGWAKSNLREEQAADERAETKRLVQLLGEGGWFRPVIPKEFGGEDPLPSVRKLCLLRSVLGYFSGLADFSAAMQGLGSVPLALFGTDEQKKRFLPGVGNGKLITTFALSEGEAGSDAAAIATTAEADGSHYVINGSKTWISNAGIADYYVVFVRTGEAPGARGLSALVVEADAPGFSLAAPIEVTSPHPLGTLSFENCRVPRTNLVGEPGAGFKVAMSTLDMMRSTVGAAAVGFAKRSFDEALSHVTGRRLFGQQLSEFQLTQDKVADMAVAIDASELLVYRAAWMKDQGAERITREASMAKLAATEAAQGVIDRAVQLLGGQGVVRDSVVERLYRDIRPLRIYEGTSEIQKLIIAKQVYAEFEKRNNHGVT